MKKNFLLATLIVLLLPVLHGGKKQTGFPVLEGPFLGQNPPGATPELFAPGIVSTGLDELNSAFSPDGGEFYFCVRNIQGAASIFQMKLEKGAWEKPQLLPFASRFGDIDASVGPVGGELLFSSLRPRPREGAGRKDNDFWLTPRKGNGWGEPVHLGAAVNSDSHDYYPMMTRDGTVYFSSQRGGPGSNDIFRSKKIDGAYTVAEKLGNAVNTEHREFDPYVSPAEDLLLFASNRPGGQGSSDLYACFRGSDGAWTPAVNLGAAVNSPGPEFSPMISPDGKYLLFTSYRFVQNVVPAAPLGLADFTKMHNQPGNGLGDIYWVSAAVIDALRPGTGGAQGADIPASRAPLELTRVANSGVMLVSGTTKVLIDALFDKPPADYRAPDAAVLDKIMQGEAPFDGVDLALVTHNHPDHFAAPLAARFLEANPTAMLLAPEDAVAEMRQEANWLKISARVVPIDLKVGEEAQHQIAGVSIAACRTLHSGKRDEPMNLMLRLRLNGWNIFHEGDADATLDEYRRFGLEEAKIDLALVHFWFPLHPEMAKLLQEVIRPAHIGLTHLPIRLENDAPGKIDMVRQYYKDIFLLLPGMPAKTFHDVAKKPQAVRALVLLGEWFGDAYFPLQKEMESRGWTQKRIGVDAEYRGCYNKKRDIALTSEILVPELKDLSAWDVLIIPSGPQFRKFKENPLVLEFLKKAHAAGLLVASFCVGNNLVKAAGLVDLPYGPALFPEKVTLVKERILLGPRGGGPPPGDGFESAPIKELCDAVETELAEGKAEK